MWYGFEQMNADNALNGIEYTIIASLRSHSQKHYVCPQTICSWKYVDKSEKLERKTLYFENLASHHIYYMLKTFPNAQNETQNQHNNVNGKARNLYS